MKLIKPSYKIESEFNREKILKMLELCGRVCYKSEDKITENSASKFVQMICKKNHESVLEHISISVRFIVNRGFTHELVRHRIASFSQESTRYCNYSTNKFDNNITFIIPPQINIESGIYSEHEYPHHTLNYEKENLWFQHMLRCEIAYKTAINQSWKPQEARGLLPIDLKTEIIITANLREWKHIFKLRTSDTAHPQMREIIIPLYNEFKQILPEIF